jgi:hypothetical protein
MLLWCSDRRQNATDKNTAHQSLGGAECVKEHRGLRRFSGHGLARVRTEFALEVLLHNLLVLHRSLGQKHHAQASHLTTEGIAA